MKGEKKMCVCTVVFRLDELSVTHRIAFDYGNESNVGTVGLAKFLMSFHAVKQHILLLH